MKKIAFLLICSLFLFSCEYSTRNPKKVEENKKIETNSGEIKNDEDFLNSEENIKNKTNAEICLSKLKNQPLFEKIYWNSWNNFIIQAFKDKNSSECYFLTFWWNFVSPSLSKLENKEKKLNYIGDFLTNFTEKLDDSKNYYFKECTQDKETLEVNILNWFDNIFLENNINPPRIIYTKEDLNNEKYFYYDFWNWEKTDFKDLKWFDNYLNYYFKYKNSTDYPEIKSFFEKINKIKLEKFLEWYKKMNFSRCYFFTLDNEPEIQKTKNLNSENYDLEKIKEEMKKYQN